jgi:DNA-binding GntR family transcriptional regulator
LLNKYSNVPLYSQLVNLIIEKIETGEYTEDSKIPSEQDYCELYDISRPTVRQAISRLTQNGFLYKKKGKGTFVASSTNRVKVKDYNGFNDSILDCQEPSSQKIISIDVVNGAFAKRLEKKFDINSTPSQKSEFAKITYLTTKENDVYSYNESYIPLTYFPDIIDDINEKKASFDIFKGKYPLVPFRTKTELEVVFTDQKDAQYLDVHTGQALMKIENTLLSKGGQIVEYIISKYRADKCRLHFENTK